MLETKNIKAPTLYKKANSGVTTFKVKVDEIYSEMGAMIIRKQEAFDLVNQLEQELELIYSDYRKETNKVKRQELELQQESIHSRIEEEKKFVELDLANFLSEKLSNNDVYDLEDKAKKEHETHVLELTTYEKAIRKHFNESISEISSFFNHNDFKEAKRLLDAIEITIRKS